MATYEELQTQIAELQAEAERVRREEITGVIARIKEAIVHYRLTAADLGLGPGRSKHAPVKPAGKGHKGAAKPKIAAKAASGAKYGDGAGNTWGGRGPRPRWLREALQSGRELKDFLI